MNELVLFFVLVVLLLIFAVFKIFSLKEEVNKKDEENRKILSQKKSSEVRLGFVSEKLAPFLDDFKLDPERLSFLGNPVDFIHFGEEEITIVEVKSGESRLSSKQRKIKKQVEDKKINWYLYKVK